jgi:predicted GTPase
MSNIVKVIKYENSIDYLIKRFPSLSFVKEVFIFPYDEIAWTCNNKTQYHLQVIFVGKTGYGKSTTVNKLVGKEIFQSNDVVACTRESQCADFTISDEYYLSLSDLPGIGESATLDQEYMELYSN